MTKNDRKKLKLKPRQKQQLKKYAVFALMIVIFCVCIWFIFKPSDKEDETKGAFGLNTELPMPKESNLIQDKLSAYQNESLTKKSPLRSLDLFTSLTGKKDSTLFDLSAPQETSTKQVSNKKFSGTKHPKKAMQNSATAYKNINKTLNNFYEKPKEKSETEKLKNEIEELKSQLAQKQSSNGLDDQLILMEKSYQLASKYMPDATSQGNATNSKGQSSITTSRMKKAIVTKPVKAVSESIVSKLEQNISDSSFVDMVSNPRNYSFITAGVESMQKNSNTICACVNSKQTLINGQSVQLRLLETIETDGYILPKNMLITGIAQIQGERLQITVHSLEYNGNIIPIELIAYDTDGQQGLFVPRSVETTAAKEITASMGRDAGTSISINDGSTVVQELAADMGRSLIQGTSQYISGKLKTTKVTLKAGHRLLLMASN